VPYWPYFCFFTLSNTWHFIPSGESIIAKWLKLQFVLKGHCHGSTAHPKYAQTWKTVCQQLIKLGMKYDILFIIPSLCRTSLLCFKNWRLLHLFQSCSINFKRFFALFILANQHRDTVLLIHQMSILYSATARNIYFYLWRKEYLEKTRQFCLSRKLSIKWDLTTWNVSSKGSLSEIRISC
jgi:hypothetical protein